MVGFCEEASMGEKKEQITAYNKNDMPDILVAGGGIAGISAALAAAREGRKVLLVEKQCMLGGLATLGLITYYLPLCDGEGHQMCHGIAEELLRLSISEGGGTNIPEEWEKNGTKEQKKKHRFEVQFNPQMLALLAEELLIKNGVRILFDTCITDVHKENDRITEVILQHKYETIAVKAQKYIDATGDADLFWLSGCSTYIYKNKNKISSWYYRNSAEGVSLRVLGESDSMLDMGKKDEEFLSKKRYSGLDCEDITDFLCNAHQSILHDVRINREKDKFYEPVTVATIPQLRMTRRFCGKDTLKANDQKKRFENSIGLIGDWRKAGPSYEIPFGCLYSDQIKNLIGAGRCISVDDEMWDITRAIPCCAITGEAAGTAAAMNEDFSDTDIEKLQKVLCKNGQKIHLEQVGVKEI